MKSGRYRVVFFGTPEFAVPTLKTLAESGDFEVVLVISQPDRTTGRLYVHNSYAATAFARSCDIPVQQPERLSALHSMVSDLKPDFLVVVAYGALLPSSFLQLPRFSALNLHPSLLPRYRGASPVQAALLAGDQETGVTILSLTKDIDAGEVFLVRRVDIGSGDTFESLSDRLFIVGAEMMLQAMRGIVSGTLTSVPQSTSGTLCCRRVFKQDGLLHWNLYDAESLSRQIRAFSYFPGCYTFFGKKRFKILEVSEVISYVQSCRAGRVVLHQDKIGICSLRGVLVPCIVQLEGKKKMEFAEFLKGHADFVGSDLG